MRTDIKVGVIVGVLLVAAVIVLVVGNRQDPADIPDGTGPADVPSRPETSPLPDEPASPPVDAAPEPQDPLATTPPTPPATISPPTLPVAPQPPSPPQLQLPPVPVPEAPLQREPRYYTVQAGDTLSQVAEMWYGSGKHWKVILDANKSLITNPDKLRVGWRLRIPYPDEVANQP